MSTYSIVNCPWTWASLTEVQVNNPIKPSRISPHRIRADAQTATARLAALALPLRPSVTYPTNMASTSSGTRLPNSA